LFVAVIQALTFSQRHTKTHADSNRCHSERDCHRSTTTQLWNADMSSSNHTKAFVQCCHGEHTLASLRTLLSDDVFKLLSSLRVHWNLWIAQYGHQQMFHVFQGMLYTRIFFCLLWDLTRTPFLSVGDAVCFSYLNMWWDFIPKFITLKWSITMHERDLLCRCFRGNWRLWGVLSYMWLNTVQICVAKWRGYILRNASLGDFIIVRTYTYINLGSIAYYTPRLYGIIACCS
jgi:hypothetical protein